MGGSTRSGHGSLASGHNYEQFPVPGSSEAPLCFGRSRLYWTFTVYKADCLTGMPLCLFLLCPFFPSFYFWGHIARNFLLSCSVLEKDERKLIRIWKPGLYSLKWLQTLELWKVGGSNKYIFWWMIVLLLLGRFGKGIKCSIIFAKSGVLGRLVTHGT